MADRAEGRVAEDQCGDDGDLVGLEEVGRHAGAVAHVVTHVVGDGGGVAGVVLGDTGLHFAHQVGADVGRLGEDTPADSHEQGEERGAEGEPDEDRGGRVLEDQHDGRGADQAQADTEHAGHGAGPERDPQGTGHAAALRRGRRRADVAPHGDAHADEAGQAGEGGAEEEADDPVEAVLLEAQGQVPVRLDHLGGGEEDQDGERHHDDGDRAELALEERLGALLDGQGDLPHFGSSGIRSQHVAGQEETRRDTDDAGSQADVQPGLVRSTKVERLVSTVACSEEVDHAWCALSVAVSVRLRTAHFIAMRYSQVEGAHAHATADGPGGTLATAGQWGKNARRSQCPPAS